MATARSLGELYEEVPTAPCLDGGRAVDRPKVFRESRISARAIRKYPAKVLRCQEIRPRSIARS